mmetsp:Transcript_62480/g.201527  ORF Transcript_62480/g.201527 Transcript_62480/m.201527 type:complete len:311 (-) Transcript_62480:102-1034(-)
MVMFVYRTVFHSLLVLVLLVQLPGGDGAESMVRQYTIEEGMVRTMEHEAQGPELGSQDPEGFVHVHGGTHSAVVQLNPYVFGAALRNEGDRSQHWIVYFCPAWWEPCQVLMEPYRQRGGRWQGRLNDGLLAPRVRFASVDCAAHKVLCNEQAVEEYPTVVHYYRGARAGRWTPSGKKDAERLAAWVDAELRHVPAASSGQLPAVVAQAPHNLEATSFLPDGLPWELFCIAVALAFNCWAFLSGPPHQQKGPAGPTMKADVPPSRELAATAETPASPGNAKPAAIVKRLEAGGVARFLPDDWLLRARCLEL